MLLAHLKKRPRQAVRMKDQEFRNLKNQIRGPQHPDGVCYNCLFHSGSNWAPLLFSGWKTKMLAAVACFRAWRGRVLH